MSHSVRDTSDRDCGRHCWRSLLWLGAALTFCSCRAMTPPTAPPSSPRAAPGAVASGVSAGMPAAGRAAMPGGMVAAGAGGVVPAAYYPPALPSNAWTGAPVDPYSAGSQACPPLGTDAMPADLAAAWRPPGITGPWPADEYVFDGGDEGAEVAVRPDWTVVGLDAEDTVAHFDTKDGRVVVEPSNRVPIYAPRFAAVRKVYAPAAHDHHDRLATTERAAYLQARGQRLSSNTATQPLEALRYDSATRAHGFRENVRGMDATGWQPVSGLIGGFRPYENFQVIRTGKFDNGEKARLAERLLAAVAWTGNQAVQVTINDQRATVAVNHADLQSVYQYEVPPGKPRLRLVKVASRQFAQPGDEIEFTLRFDNVGDQTVGNLTIVDSLSTRLEYVPDSAQCSVPARFLSQDSQNESLVLRWEITKPVGVTEGGIIRFKCKVR